MNSLNSRHADGWSAACSHDDRRQDRFMARINYGSVRDDGHFYHEATEGDFTVSATVAGAYHTLYDQAGLMMRINALNLSRPEWNWWGAGASRLRRHAGGLRLVHMSGLDAPSCWISA